MKKDSRQIKNRSVLRRRAEALLNKHADRLDSLSAQDVKSLVETYRSRLMKNLGVKNIPSLVMFAVQHGITPLH